MSEHSIRKAINNAKYLAKKSKRVMAVQTWVNPLHPMSVTASVPADDSGGTGVTVHAFVHPCGEVFTAAPSMTKGEQR